MNLATALQPLMKVAVIMAIMVMTTMALAEIINLPEKGGARPTTTSGVPHIQLDIAPIPEISSELLQRVANIPGVTVANTVISLPGAKGFWVNEDVALARPDVIVGGREFAHLHPDGSLHASLPPALAKNAVASGWATPHPWANKRKGWEGFVMIYTPMNNTELEVVYELVVASYEFVTGERLPASSQ